MNGSSLDSIIMPFDNNEDKSVQVGWQEAFCSVFVKCVSPNKEEWKLLIILT